MYLKIVDHLAGTHEQRGNVGYPDGLARRLGAVANCSPGARELAMRVAVAAARAFMWRCSSRLLGSLCFLVIALAPSAGQQGDLNGILKRQSQFMEAGDYAAALVESAEGRGVGQGAVWCRSCQLRRRAL